ncbi:MAG: bifunctional 4-hydroxy-2-oxoglutarate aldolase/2-dehydro-3-deoxy-phosphogluconate aldolase [Gammaproteobacteria bacterium]|nr:bifunctional 4-hydroxy-2-oxoglutarate aldolase/2-dehydro-3-deoxy-phosphogluconate aldolase [Gammaproteobacteria bacterium]
MYDELLKRPIIPVIVIDREEDAEPLAEALLAGGLDIIEVTFRTPAAAGAIKRVHRAFPEMLLGAGTLLSAEMAERAIEAGVSFGLAPGLNPKVASYFQSCGGLFVPGVMTPSEIEQGLELGCRLQKFFPAGEAGGPAMLKALAGPYASQGVRFCPTGGVNLTNMRSYLELPIVASIGGSWLATRQQIADGEWAAITRQAKEAMALARR